MGILDDAIREHLELIRRRGATDSEVQRLEDEAFGPPTRPDEADFPQSEEAGAASANGVATETAVEEPGPQEAAAHEDVTTLMPSTETPEAAGEAGTGLEEPTGAHVTEQESDEMPLDEAESREVEQEEAPAEEHAILEEPQPEAEPELHEDEPPVEEDVVPPEQAAAPPEEATSLYDQGSEHDLEVDLDLQLEDEVSSTEPPSEEAPAEPEGTRPIEPPIESLDTVEHPFPEEVVEETPDAPSDEYAVEEVAAPEQAEEGEEEKSEQGEDVLADTPEFLKDAPEDDELWFEQGEPKDFDF